MFKKINILLILFGLFLGVFIRSVQATDYFPIGENLLNNTTSLSGTTGDLQTDDTNYRVLRSFPSAYNADFQTTAVDVATTATATTSYVDKAVLTWTVPSNGTYLVYATAEIKRGSTTAARTAKAQMTIDGTSYAETFVADDVDVDTYRSFSGVEIQNLTAGSHTVKIQFTKTNTTSNICSIKNARITAMRVDNTQFNVPANGTTTSTSYADIATLTFTPKTTESWLIMSHTDITSNGTTYLNYANLMVGSTQLSEGVFKVSNAAHYLPFDAYHTISLNANTSYSFKLQMKASAGTLTYKNVGLYAIPKSIFSASSNAEAIGQTTCSTCTSASPTTIATLNINTGIGGTYLIIATGEQGTGSTAVYSGINLKVGAGTVSQSIIDVGNTAQYSSFSLQKIISLSTGSTVVSVQLFAQTTGTTVRAKDIRIQAIKLGAASAQKMEVEYSGIGDTLNSNKIDYFLNSAFSLSSIGTTLQLWNYNSSAYPTSGDGFYSYTSNSTANTFEQQTQSITTNPNYFKNSTTGAWKLKISSINPNGNWIDWSGNLLKYVSTVSVASTAPETPTLSLPVNSSTDQSLTPTFQTVATDDNEDSLQYELKICTNSGMTTNCQTFDQTSNNVGWSGQDVGTSAYSSGTTASYVLQIGNSLAQNTTYYWKTRAIDPSGTNTWSSTQNTPYSFTTLTITPIFNQNSFRWSNDTANESHAIGDTWYDSNYDYRNSIQITNNIGTTLSDFQVRLTIGTSALIADGKMRSDCNDLRFTNEDKNTLLNYWIETGCNSSNTIIWVKIPYLAASTSRNIYLYYGNSSASIGSEGNNTFDFFDDFSGTSLNTSKWTEWNPNSWGNLNISGGTLALSGTNSGSTRIGHGFISANTFSFSNHRVEYSARWNFLAEPSDVQTLVMRIGSTNPTSVSSGPSYKYRFYTSYDTWSSYYGYLTNSFNSSNIEATLYDDYSSADSIHNIPTSFETEQFNWYSSTYLSTKDSKDNGATWTTHGSSSYNNTVVSMSTPQAFGAQIESISGVGESMVAWFDWYRIRKYATTEPTFNLGTETTRPEFSWLATENIGITNVNINSNLRLRFSINNNGDSTAANFRLQVAPKGVSSNCTNVASVNFSDVPTTAGSAMAVMTTSPEFTNQESTTNQLTNSDTTFIAGKIVEYSSNQTDSLTLNNDNFTEIEYNFQMTNNVGSTTPYCFRVVNVGTTLNTYSQIAQLTIANLNKAPNAPYLPYVNNTTAQTGQQTPVYGLIDHTPAFSAIFDDYDTSDTSSYYQLQVGTDTDWTTAETWDSNKTSMSSCNENSRCNDIIYNGGALTDGSTYYWRLKFWDNLDVGGSWSDTQQFSLNSPPVVSNIIINNNNSINLSENSSIGISWVSTITDTDGYTNLSSATGKLYRSGVGSSCTPDNNNCYSDAVCDFYNCSSNVCSALCNADIYFFTEATDVGSTYVDQYYQAFVQATDIRSEIGSTISTSIAIDVNSMSGFSIGSSLVYGEVFAGSDTGSSNTITTITNTGNSLINLEITGDYMCTDYPACGGQNIEPKNQEYDLTSFTYGNGTTLSTSPATVNIGISKPTQTPSNSFKNLYWGIGIPSSQGLGNYQGATTILVY